MNSRYPFSPAARSVAAVLISGVCVSCPATARCSTVAEDNFEGVDETDKVALVESKTTWECPANRQSLAVMHDELLGSGKALAVLNGLAYARITDTELPAGGSITLSLRFRSLDDTKAYPLPVRIGLCWNGDGAPDAGETKGYWLFTGPGPETKSGISFESNTDASLGGGNDGEAIGTPFQLDFDWSVPHSLTVRISRTGTDTVEIATRLDDGQEHVVSGGNAPVTKFNLFAIRIANTPQSRFLIDDLKMECKDP